MPPKNLPIGYWIRQADNALTKAVDAVQAEMGLSRTGWQVLHSLATGTAKRRDEIVQLMAQFADEKEVNGILDTFRENGQVYKNDRDELKLTEAGMAWHQKCFAMQTTLRTQLTQSISDEEYATTIRTLVRLIENAGGLGSRSPKG